MSIWQNNTRHIINHTVSSLPNTPPKRLQLCAGQTHQTDQNHRYTRLDHTHCYKSTTAEQPSSSSWSRLLTGQWSWLTLRGMMVCSDNAGTSTVSFRSRLVIMGGRSCLKGMFCSSKPLLLWNKLINLGDSTSKLHYYIHYYNFHNCLGSASFYMNKKNNKKTRTNPTKQTSPTPPRMIDHDE